MANWADGILSPLKAASGLVQEAIEIRDEIKLRDTIIKLSAQIMAAQSGALAAQSDQLSLLDEIRSLKEKVVELEAWNTEKGRYKLTDLGRGLKTYTLKEGMERRIGSGRARRARSSSLTLGDSVTQSIRTRFLVHTPRNVAR